MTDLEDHLADLELEAAALLEDTQAFLDTVVSAAAQKLWERVCRTRLGRSRSGDCWFEISRVYQVGRLCSTRDISLTVDASVDLRATIKVIAPFATI